jgi:predicted porin
MQKKLLTVAVAGALALPAVALAQVTVFGTMDGGIRNQSKALVGGVGPATGSVLLGTDGLRTTNRWGLRGSEDMGGGLMANFWLEGQYGSDTGALGSSPATGNGPTLSSTTGSANVNQGLFQRKAVVGLSKGGNSVDIGRDYTVNFKTQGIYDPMSYTYTGIAPTAGTNTAGVRSSNMVTAGFRFGTGGVRVDYAMGEVVDENSGSTRIGFNGDFKFGPVTVAGAYSTQDNAAATLSTDTMNIGAVYGMGAFTFRAGWSDTEVETGPGAKTNTPMFVLGAQYAFSPTLNGRVGYYNTKFETNGVETGTRKVSIVALDYVLSKRTTAYFAFDRTAIDGTASNAVLGIASADGATGLSAGIAHSF